MIFVAINQGLAYTQVYTVNDLSELINNKTENLY